MRAKTSTNKEQYDDIIELQDIRMSPIPSIRNRQTTYSEIDTSKFPPSFRISRNSTYRPTGLRYRGNRGDYTITFFKKYFCKLI